MIKFYDTNALLNIDENSLTEHFVLSDITLSELENIKISAYKDERTKYKARKATRFLAENADKYTVVFAPNENIIKEKYPDWEINNDFKLVYCASQYAEKLNDELSFISDDLSCRNIAKNVFGLSVSGTDDSVEEEYTGYKEIILSEEEIAELYNTSFVNKYELLENQYLLVKNMSGGIVDILKWRNNQLIGINQRKFSSSTISKDVKPYNNDPYQKMLFDALMSTQLVLINGAAGTGKSYIALAYLFQQLEKHKIDKIVVFTNTVPAKGAAKLGFYPGSRTEKLVDSQIGIMLGSKIGDGLGLEMLIGQGKLELIPMSDIRGYDTSGKNCAVYITEAQNFDIELMRLALQRIGEDTMCVIDGDFNTQVDMAMFGGANNGMRRVSEIFKGEEFYSQVTLKNIYRSKIAEIAQKM